MWADGWKGGGRWVEGGWVDGCGDVYIDGWVIVWSVGGW